MMLLVLTLLMVALAYADNCSTWLYSRDGHCVCGSGVGNVVVCNNETREVGIRGTYCLTSNGEKINMSVVGSCPVQLSRRKKLFNHVDFYYRVLPNISEQDQHMCGHLNRHGTLCGQCRPNHSISVYSYDIKCYPCPSSSWSSVLKYISIAYIPLTVFLCVVVLLRISVTSPAMNVPVLYCQMLSLPFVLRFVLQYARYLNHTLLIVVRLVSALYGIWNLDFFRTLLPPICLPLKAIELIALDYLVAVYPLLVLVLFYLLVSAQDRGCRIVMLILRPFLWLTARMRQQWNVRHSIIDAFATFLILSYIKFLNTSVDLLMFTNVYDEHHSLVGTFLYNDPTIRFMGREHLPYAFLAIAILLAVNVFPLLLMLLYPMLWFQRMLNHCQMNSPGLQIFMKSFQGCYRDRTDGGLECRYFAVVYPAFRIATLGLCFMTLGKVFFPSITLFCLSVLVAIILLQPYKEAHAFYNRQDALLFVCFTVMSVSFDEVFFSLRVVSYGLYIVAFLFLLPIFYFAYLILKHCIIYSRLYICQRGQSMEDESLSRSLVNLFD